MFLSQLTFRAWNAPQCIGIQISLAFFFFTGQIPISVSLYLSMNTDVSLGNPRARCTAWLYEKILT